MATDLATEQEEQRHWRLRSKWENVDWFDTMIENEFLSPNEQHDQQSTLLTQMLQFASTHVPYYKELFDTQNINPVDICQPEDLHQIPVLQRKHVQEQAEELKASQLPHGHSPGGYTKTSGSTGQPVQVLHTRQSMQMFSLLACREVRWNRFDITGTYASIRPVQDLPQRPDGTPLNKGESFKLPAWRYIGAYFHTGPSIGYSGLNPVEDQITWLHEQQPNYLLALSARLEHLALALEGTGGPDSLRGLRAISQTLTPSMRRKIEGNFGVPVYEDYGLNEIGIVAVRCMEGGRYHVHSEHCLVEITDDDGIPVAAGETGHLLVTSLSNVAMPLIRYDTGDLAEAVAGPCPCGRTLPSFAKLRGRYSRVAFLPPGTLERWVAVEHTLEQLPTHLATLLRQYQMYQFKDLTSELRVVATAPISGEFRQLIENAWEATTEGEVMPLRIVQLEEIPRGRNEKFERFVSEFTPAPDSQ